MLQEGLSFIEVNSTLFVLLNISLSMFAVLIALCSYMKKQKAKKELKEAIHTYKQEMGKIQRNYEYKTEMQLKEFVLKTNDAITKIEEYKQLVQISLSDEVQGTIKEVFNENLETISEKTAINVLQKINMRSY